MKILLQYSTFILTFIVLVLHGVGLFYFLSDELRPQLLPLTPVNLIITSLILFMSYRDRTMKFFLFAVLVYVTGMTVEMIGVNTGILFGDYYYMKSLGTQLFGVPYVIGLNWLMLVLSAGSIVFHIKVNWFWKGWLGAALMVGLDILIEQVAPDLLFWKFEGGNVPIWNYITWYLIALPLFWIGFKWKIITKSWPAVNIFVILLVFFLVLNLGL